MEKLQSRTDWYEFLASHPELRTDVGMLGSLFDDVRPGWEGFHADARTATTSEATLFRAAMARALFDDVRPDWEEHVAA